jgi:Na+/H+ antiporter NhaC
MYVVMQRILTGATVPGFAFLASSVSFFGGIQLLSIGVIGEYIAQIFTRTSDQPTFAIRNIVKSDNEHSDG